MVARLNQEAVIERFKEVHGDFYDYSKVVYKIKREKVVIICPEHGEFSQLPNSHWRGRGCYKCGRFKGFKKGGYSSELLELHPELIDDPLSIYKIKLTGHGESFYKIGLSMSPTDRGRFRYYRYAGYEVEVLNIKELTFGEAIPLEQKIKEENVDNQYWPNKRFAGFTECFSKIGGEYV